MLHIQVSWLPGVTFRSHMTFDVRLKCVWCKRTGMAVLEESSNLPVELGRRLLTIRVAQYLIKCRKPLYNRSYNLANMIRSTTIIIWMYGDIWHKTCIVNLIPKTIYHNGMRYFHSFNTFITSWSFKPLLKMSARSKCFPSEIQTLILAYDRQGYS